MCVCVCVLEYISNFKRFICLIPNCVLKENIFRRNKQNKKIILAMLTIHTYISLAVCFLLHESMNQILH